MAADFGVYFLSSKAPSVTSWQEGCDHLGYEIRIHEADLLTHQGTLPVCFHSDSPNLAFEFEITKEWGGLDDCFPGEDTSFAYFRCFAREWEAAANAALGFAKAAGGIFSDPLGQRYDSLESAIRYVEDDIEKHRE